MPHGWEGNSKSGVAVAMHHGLSGLSTYGLKGLKKGDEHPAFAPVGVWHLYLYLNNLCIATLFARYHVDHWVQHFNEMYNLVASCVLLEMFAEI